MEQEIDVCRKDVQSFIQGHRFHNYSGPLVSPINLILTRETRGTCETREINHRHLSNLYVFKTGIDSLKLHKSLTQHTMDCKIALLLPFSCLCLHFLKLYFSSKQNWGKLPPGPKPLPIFGNIFQISENPHHSLASLSRIYGSLMTLKLGSITTVVISSADVAREVFQLHDKSFSARRIPDSARALNHHSYSMAWLPTSHQWKNLRKISAVHLFTKTQLDATQLLRQKKVQELFEYVKDCCKNSQPVDIGKAAFTTSLNFLSNTFFSIDLSSHDSVSSQEFMDLVHAMSVVAGKPNISDFFPVLSYFDLFGIRRELEGYHHKLFAVFDDIIRPRLSTDPSSPSTEDDVLATLLKISKEDDSDLSLEDINHLLMDLFSAGADTTSSTLEWAMTELLLNPTKLAKAQTEIDEVLGKDNMVQESDVGRLPYLQAVVKETFRLHPPAPLLLPHNSVDEVNLCGYVVPKNTQLLVNIWAMGRDPNTWKNAENFDPERFMGSEIDVKGHHYMLMPFGTGRRICPGLPLAYRMLHLMLATLLQSFKWKLEGEMRGEEVDMTEKFGLSLHKAKPLLAVPLVK